MQLSEHLIALYVATCGQNGPGLGSDEKEIILLVYVVIEATTAQIIGTKQILVRPDCNSVKGSTTCTSSSTELLNSSATAGALFASTTQTTPTIGTATGTTPAITAATAAAASSQQSGGVILNNTNNFNGAFTTTSNTNSNGSSNNNTNASILNFLNNNNNNNNNNIVNNFNINTNANANNNNNNNLLNGSTTSTEIVELPIVATQTAGKPLNDAIAEFDEYLRSLSLNTTDCKIVTDGQLPLRQCLHREACVKGIDLPAYYNKFSDLRKEFNIYKSGDLARALVPLKDIKKFLQLPVTALPQSISEMMQGLNLVSQVDDEFYLRESRDMVTVIQYLLKSGHKFNANEVINLNLEPGICSIDDEIDGDCIVRARGLPWQSSDQDIAKFFRGLNVAKGGVALCLSPLGRRNGEALIRFVSQEHRDMALKRHKHHIGQRYIEVYRATGNDFLSVAGGASNEAQTFLSKGAEVIIRMRGLPYDCTAKQVLDFFNAGENPCQVLDGTEGVLFVKKPDGRATGDAFVLFANDSDAPKALSRHRESIGQRYIELFRSTSAEVQQVLNRSIDTKSYETNHQSHPLIAQLPSMQLSLLPQHLITSGTTKNCIRLRGLPYEALVEHILHFLHEFAKHIIFQGVHMVINSQGQPSGEAFIQMDSEESARLCAQRKHHQFMVFGKKYRYIEVFQCSGDDMNAVLHGGLQSPGSAPPTHSHSHLSAGKQASLLSPGMLAQSQPSNAISSHTHASHTYTHSHTLQSPSVAAAVAAIAQTPHLSLPVSGTPVAAPASPCTLPSFINSNCPSPSVQHTSLAAAAAAAQNAAAVGQLTGTPSQLPVSAVAASNVSPQSAMTFPFNISLPPPTTVSAVASNAILAQQQAQFIAQQNLLARQQVAAEQHSLYANLNPFLLHHPAANAVASNTLNNSAAAAAAAAAAATPLQPHFLFMPRPYFQPFPMGYIPSQQNYPFAGVLSAPTAAAAANNIHAVAAAAAAASGTCAATAIPANLPQAIKRSYENAFHQQSSSTAIPAKRPLTRPTPNLYTFYNPGGATAAAMLGGPPFGPFAAFMTSPAMVTAPFHSHGHVPDSSQIPSNHHHHRHHQHQAHYYHHHHQRHQPGASATHQQMPTAYYTPPIMYWSYPSPPVSPTYFPTPTHSPSQLHPATSHRPPPPLYSYDYIPALQTNGFTTNRLPSISPPAAVALTAPVGNLLISPDAKTPALSVMTSAKGYAMAITPIAPAITPTYHPNISIMSTTSNATHKICHQCHSPASLIPISTAIPASPSPTSPPSPALSASPASPAASLTSIDSEAVNVTNKEANLQTSSTITTTTASTEVTCDSIASPNIVASQQALTDDLNLVNGDFATSTADKYHTNNALNTHQWQQLEQQANPPPAYSMV